MPSEVAKLAFYCAIFFTLLGAVLGLLGIWSRDFWSNEWSAKLLLTDGVFLATSIVVAAITKWLS